MTTTANDFLRRGTLNGGTYRWDVRGLFRHLAACFAVARERRELLALDDRALRDIGVRHIDAAQEANRAFWDLPDDLKLRS